MSTIFSIFHLRTDLTKERIYRLNEKKPMKIFEKATVKLRKDLMAKQYLKGLGNSFNSVTTS